jgi:hypothetical protein
MGDGDCGCGGGDKCVTKEVTKAVVSNSGMIAASVMAVGAVVGSIVVNYNNNYLEVTSRFYLDLAQPYLKFVGPYVFPSLMTVVSMYAVYDFYTVNINSVSMTRADDKRYANIEQTKADNMASISTAKVIIGDSTNDLMIADDSESKIWTKAGLDYMKAVYGDDTYYFSISAEKEVNYKPFAFNIEQTKAYNMAVIPTAKVMIGDSTNDLMIADDSGSQIWAKSGLNYMKAGKGDDIFYFSLCSTSKTTDEKVSFIESFDPKHDTIKFFCTKYKIKQDDVVVKYINYFESEATCIEVKGEVETSVICMSGYVDIAITDDILTNLADVKVDLGIS